MFDLNLAAGQARLACMLMRRKLTIVARWHVSGDGVWANLYELSKVRVIVQKETSYGDCLLSRLLSYVYSLPSSLFFVLLCPPTPLHYNTSSTWTDSSLGQNSGLPWKLYLVS